jgi:hypothetical protein
VAGTRVHTQLDDQETTSIVSLHLEPEFVFSSALSYVGYLSSKQKAHLNGSNGSLLSLSIK